MKTGIIGGTLDPVHMGHIAVARMAMEACGLDGVWLMPSGDPPHKQHCAPRADRYEMARLACEGLSWLKPSDLETKREGTTYTVDTLRALKEDQPETQWWFIAGADALGSMHHWVGFAELARMCGFAIVGRSEIEEEALREQIRRLEAEFSARIVRVEGNGPDIGSAEIRRRVARGEDIGGLVPDGVGAYIQREGLYLCAMTRQEILERLQRTLKPGRFRHTLGVADTAWRLASVAGVDPQRAKLAGLLHDCAKSEDVDAMRRRVAEAVEDTDEAELDAPAVLHAPMGMLLAKEVYGVQDPQILSAIRRHTIGDWRMSAMDKLIFVADYIEPNRKPFPGLEAVRALAEKDIDAAARLCAAQSAAYVRAQGKAPHPKTLAMAGEPADHHL